MGRRPSIPKLKLGTRGSRLALAQAEKVKNTLTELHEDLEVEIVIIKTSGDRGERTQIGAFVREIQEAILDHRVDVGLHCLKDLPVERIAGLTLAAHLKREDPRDTLIGRVEGLGDLRANSIVGTGSIRRTSQIAHLRPDLHYKPLVGNVDTRLRKLLSGEYGAIVLAIAGLKRLGLLDTWKESEFAQLLVTPMSLEVMLPAPGQAVLVLETRAEDRASQGLVSSFEDPETRLCATAERAFLKVFGGGCSMPIASLGTVSGGVLSLAGLIASPDGSRVLRGTFHGPAADPQGAAQVLADQLESQGARKLLKDLEVVS